MEFDGPPLDFDDSALSKIDSAAIHDPGQLSEVRRATDDLKMFLTSAVPLLVVQFPVDFHFHVRLALRYQT